MAAPAFAAGLNSAFDARVVPSVAYTDPEVAWVGVTEIEAKQQKLKYGKGMFPWAASGRSLSLGRDEGLTKLIFDEDTDRVIGAGLVGPNAGDLIAEVALAIETGCDARDIGLTIHPHPTLSETVAMAAEAFEGTITDLYMPPALTVKMRTISSLGRHVCGEEVKRGSRWRHMRSHSLQWLWPGWLGRLRQRPRARSGHPRSRS
jgi:hypothetical protein